MRRAVDGSPFISSVHGQRTSMGMYGKHLGYDYAGYNLVVRAPENLVITGLFSGGSGGNYIEANSGNRTHRFLHLKRNSVFSAFKVRVGQSIPEGTEIGRSGRSGFVTGAHLHHDTRKKGTAWNSSFSNYIDWEKIIRSTPAPTQPRYKMPAIGSRIQLTKGFHRTTYRAGTRTKAGTLVVRDNTYIYTVRAYDPRYSNRILLNSRSAGGDGVALALFYFSGKPIEGWKAI